MTTDVLVSYVNKSSEAAVWSKCNRLVLDFCVEKFQKGDRYKMQKKYLCSAKQKIKEFTT